VETSLWIQAVQVNWAVKMLKTLDVEEEEKKTTTTHKTETSHLLKK